MDRGGVKPCARLGQKILERSRSETRSRARRCSLRLNAGRPDHLAPLLGIIDDEFAELGG